MVSSSQHRENCLAAQSLFINFCLPPTSLQVELLPYLAKLSNPMRNPGNHSLLREEGVAVLSTP